MKALFAVIVLALAAVTAHSQTTTTCTGSYGTITCTTDDPRQQSDFLNHFANAGKANFEAAGRQLGQIINNSLQPKPKTQTDAVVATKCGKYRFSLVTYSDNSTNRVELGDVAVDPVTTVKIVNMGFRIVDLTCDE